MTTKDIRPTDSYTPCDICGRTLLRGERAEVFIAGGNRHQVCELCKPRALHEGWIREGSVPDYDPSAADAERRRGVFGRRRSRRERGNGRVTLDDALSGQAWGPPEPAEDEAYELAEPEPEPQRPAARPGRSAPRPRRRERSTAESQPAPRVREPRHVRAVPTSEDHRIDAAIESFNQTEHLRTVSGVARSLGVPTVAVIPDATHPSLVHITVSWELCWYRYEVDLGAERASVRLDGQGYELAELPDREKLANAAADDAGQLRAV